MKITIEVQGGVVQSVMADYCDVEVIVVDYDNIEGGDPGPAELTFSDDMTVEDFFGRGWVVW